MYLILFGILFLSSHSHQDVIVETPMGTIKGSVFQSMVEGEFNAFLGVPYAKPPVGKLRFMAPQLVEPWEGEYDATVEKSKCVQMNWMAREATGNEDCLYMNIFTPSNLTMTKDEPVPVLVWFHGGAFHMGGNLLEDGGPDFLMTKDVILVTVAYRLSLFGSLSLENELVPGNNCLKDWVLSLHWIQKNIPSFGGDPKSVTIMGISAGGVGAHMLILSKAPKGLFHKAFIISGTAISPWALSEEPRKTAILLGKVFDCETENDANLILCLQAADAYELALSQYHATPLKKNMYGNFLFSPCVEPNVSDALMTEDPFRILQSGNFHDVPVLIGISEHELNMLTGALRNGMLDQRLLQQQLNTINKYFTFQLPHRPPGVVSDFVAEKVKHYYFGDKPISVDTAEELTKFYEDTAYVLPLHDSIRLMVRSKKAPVYSFLLTADTEYGYFKNHVPFIATEGATHVDMMGYLLFQEYHEIDPEDSGFKVMKRLIQLVYNFAKFGKPTLDDSEDGLTWPPATETDNYYLDLGEEEFVPKKNFRRETVEFWESLRALENMTV